MDVSTFIANRRTLPGPGGEIAYTEWGSGPAAVFVHGVATSGALWRNVIELLDGTSRCIAVDLPGHGGTPPREDPSVGAMATMVAEMCERLGLDQVDLVGLDTGGAVAQLVAVRYPGMLRSLTLTNCDTEGDFPPPSFAPVVAAAARGELAQALVSFAADPAAARQSPLAASYEHPERVPDDAWMEYLRPLGADIERARYFERVLAAMDPAELKGVDDRLRGLDVPTLVAWSTGEGTFGIEWARRLCDLIPGARDLVEIEGKLFYPEERPEELVAQLRKHWGR
jgi:pimeloyl-ACP methyl ester carboxylesterase